MVAVLSPDVLPEIRFSVDEYLQADLPEGQRYELVNGVVEMTPSPGGMHDEAVEAMVDAVWHYRQANPDAIEHVGFNASVPIPGTASVREPDLAFYREWSERGKGWQVWKESTPFLIVEIVSPGQQKRDYEDKRQDYWSAGIEEYWIVDPTIERITVLSRGTDGWREATFRRGERATSTALPGFAVAADRFFGPGSKAS